MNIKIFECDCKDWGENIKKLNSGFALQSIHGMGGYSGKTFIYCPWCRKELKEVQDEDK